MPAASPPPPMRNDYRLDLRAELLDELQAERALTGEHERVLEGVDVGLSRFDPLLGGHGSVVEAEPGEDDVCAVALGRLDLCVRGVLGHEDGCAHPGFPCGPSDRLAVVARARGDDARSALGVGELRDPVVGAADLERACALEVLGLEPHRAAREAPERLRGDDGGLARDTLEPSPRLLDLSERRACRRRHPAP